MKHVMVDLETWGIKPFSTILSIGAVCFNPTKTGVDAIEDEFYVTIDPIASERAGFRKDADTLAWWLQPAQSAAWREWYETVHFEPQAAFFGLSEWLGALCAPDVAPDERVAQVAIWGNGAGFDNTLLRQGYELLQMEPPWLHSNDRCFRTMKHLIGPVDQEVAHLGRRITAKNLAPPHEGLKHNALVDARQQALWLCNIVNQFALAL